MSNVPRLFCLDTVLIDVVLKIDALPQRGGDALANEKLVTTGGGFNAMSAARATWSARGLRRTTRRRALLYAR